MTMLRLHVHVCFLRDQVPSQCLLAVSCLHAPVPSPEKMNMTQRACCSDWGALAREVCDPITLRLVEAGGPGAAAVLPRLWGANREALLRGLVGVYEADAARVGRVLDVCQVHSLLAALGMV